MIVKIKKIEENAKIPKKANPTDAGFDLYACHDDEIIIKPHQTVMIHTGLVMEIPEGYYGGIYARSGLASKKNLRPANCVGVVDAHYRGEVMIALHNDSDDVQTINGYERIAQMIIAPVPGIDIVEVSELSNTDRGTGGFGSTGTN